MYWADVAGQLARWSLKDIRFDSIDDPHINVPPETRRFLCAIHDGAGIRFRSGCAVEFVAYLPHAKPHCQLVLLNPATGNVCTRFANGKGSTEPFDEPGDIILA